MNIYAITCVDSNWAIGYKNNLLIKLQKDMDFFKKKTIGSVVVMGKKTFDSLPGTKGLPCRENVVITRKDSRFEQNIIVCSSIDKAIDYIKKRKKDVYIIGGSSIYKEFSCFCKFIYVTKVYKVFLADSFFENLDKNKNWKITEKSKIFREDGVDFQFFTYKNLNYKNIKSKV